MSLFLAQKEGNGEECSSQTKLECNKPDTNYTANLYKSVVFGIQKTDQEIELNESFSFRVRMELDHFDLMKIQKDDGSFSNQSFYDSTPFYLECQLYSLKCKFAEMQKTQIDRVFKQGRLAKCQVITLSLKNPIKGMSSYFFVNFKGDHLSQCSGTIHSLLINLQQSNNKNKKRCEQQKENEDYIHIELNNRPSLLGGTLKERNGNILQNWKSSRNSSIIKLKRLDKCLLDQDGNRLPSNLTEFLFGDPETGFCLSRDNNLKCYVKYEETIKVFSKVLKPLYRSYECIKQQYDQLFSSDQAQKICGNDEYFLQGIEDLKAFSLTCNKAKPHHRFKEEFTPDQICSNFSEARDYLRFSKNQTIPHSYNHDFESINDVGDLSEPFMLAVEESEPPQKPREEAKSTDDSDDFAGCNVEETDEFYEKERSPTNRGDNRDKIDLGYSTINYRTSLIPTIKNSSNKIKESIGLSQLSHFDHLIMQNVKTSDPAQITKILMDETSYVGSQIIAANKKFHKLLMLCYNYYLEYKQKDFLKEFKTKAEECIFSERHESKDFVAIQGSPLEILTRVVEHRRSPFYDEIGVETVISEYPKLRSSKSPIMMEENYFLDDKYPDLDSADLVETPNQERPLRLCGKIHIFVLVHGLGGSQVDLLAYKNYISIVNPNAEFIISCKNSRENMSSSSSGLDNLAENLASEIDADIEFHGLRNIEKISFIGFSLGGIIIRAALPLLSKYKDKFFSYISLATPHLGVKLK